MWAGFATRPLKAFRNIEFNRDGMDSTVAVGGDLSQDADNIFAAAIRTVPLPYVIR